MSGQCLSVDGGMEGRIIWKEEEVPNVQQGTVPKATVASGS
jgi:hypothetical protein